jgi:GAF domain-containing protein
MDPDGGEGNIHDLLTAAVDETARLLDADGAMVYLLDPATDHLRFAHDAGIKSARSRARVRAIALPVGVGMFGRAVAEREMVITGNYLEDPSFDHAEEPDRVVRDLGIQSMVVAPLGAGDEVFGAIGTFSSRPDAFTSAQIALVRALADHAGAAIRNVHLIEELARSRGELARTADAERTLREIAARVSAILDPAEVLQRIVDETTRLLESDGARIDLYDPAIDALRWAYTAGDAMAIVPDWARTGGLRPGQGVAGTAFAVQRPVRTDDYL